MSLETVVDSPDLGAETPSECQYNRTFLSPSKLIPLTDERADIDFQILYAKKKKKARVRTRKTRRSARREEGERRENTLGVLRRPPQFADPVCKEQKSMSASFGVEP